jgi:hypothetical protein
VFQGIEVTWDALVGAGHGVELNGRMLVWHVERPSTTSRSYRRKEVFRIILQTQKARKNEFYGDTGICSWTTEDQEASATPPEVFLPPTSKKQHQLFLRVPKQRPGRFIR